MSHKIQPLPQKDDTYVGLQKLGLPKEFLELAKHVGGFFQSDCILPLHKCSQRYHQYMYLQMTLPPLNDL